MSNYPDGYEHDDWWCEEEEGEEECDEMFDESDLEPDPWEGPEPDPFPREEP